MHDSTTLIPTHYRAHCKFQQSGTYCLSNFTGVSATRHISLHNMGNLLSVCARSFSPLVLPLLSLLVISDTSASMSFAKPNSLPPSTPTFLSILTATLLKQYSSHSHHPPHGPGHGTPFLFLSSFSPFYFQFVDREVTYNYEFGSGLHDLNHRVC